MFIDKVIEFFTEHWKSILPLVVFTTLINVFKLIPKVISLFINLVITLNSIFDVFPYPLNYVFFYLFILGMISLTIKLITSLWELIPGN